MGRIMAAIYDRMNAETEAACLQRWRADLLHDLAGDVLEVGAGTGANLALYPPGLHRLVVSEPDRHMRRRLAARMAERGGAPMEIVDWVVDRLPVPDESFDAVVATLVLCSVPDLGRAIAEIHRVLKPGGRFVFLEHVAAEQRPRRLRWQRRVEPVWKRIAGNCHLTRRTADAIAAGGFRIEKLTRESMRKAWPLVRPTIRGVAAKGA